MLASYPYSMKNRFFILSGKAGYEAREMSCLTFLVLLVELLHLLMWSLWLQSLAEVGMVVSLLLWS